MSKAILILLFTVAYHITSAQSSNWNWIQKAGSPDGDQCNSLIFDSKGNFIFTGIVDNNIGYMVFGDIRKSKSPYKSGYVAKYNQEGKSLWLNLLGTSSDGINCTDVTTDDLDNIYIIGDYIDKLVIHNLILTTLPGEKHSFIVKYNDNGDLLWVKDLGKKSILYGLHIRKNALYITGNIGNATTFEGLPVKSHKGKLDYFVSKFDTSGNIIWLNNGGGNDFDFGFNVTTDSDENVYITASCYTPPLYDNIVIDDTLDNAYLLKYSKDGSLCWIKNVVNYYTYIKHGGISIDKENNIYISGHYYQGCILMGTQQLSNNGLLNAFIAKTDSSGNLLWFKEITGPDAVWVKDQTIDSKSNLYLTGHYNKELSIDNKTLKSNPAAPQDIFITCIDSTGTLLWIENTEASIYGTASTIAINPLENDIIIGGAFTGSISFKGKTILSVNTTDDILLASLNNNLLTSTGKLGTPEHTVSIFPNPTPNGSFQLTFKNILQSNNQYKLVVLNSVGIKEIERNISPNDIDNLQIHLPNKGLFYVKLLDANNTTLFTKKIVY